MNKKQSKRQRDIKSKLMAAICMLLVSSIMMVSSTYAWFTLSTAPEVTGISTAVGANGNLEMALQPLDGDSSKIVSGTGDSMAVKPVKDANTTWGNLVNLAVTGSNGYGLENISLYPAALAFVDAEAADKVINERPLATPKYGADGRIQSLEANTFTGVYRDGAFYQTADNNGTQVASPYGVRAIGTASGITPRNLAYRSALSTANTAAGQAKSTASTSLNNNGSILADVAIARALEKDAARYTQEQVNAMKAIVDALLGTETITGSLQHIENALRQYIVASSIAPAATENNFQEIVDAITADTVSLADLADGKVSVAVVSTNMKEWIGKLATAKASAQTARDELADLTSMPEGGYTWDDISGALTPLINTANLEICTIPINEVMQDPNKLITKYFETKSLDLTMKSGAGVYADIADFAGDYSAGITIARLQYGDTIDVPNVPANMNTNGEKPTYLSLAAEGVADFVAMGGGSGDAPLTDFYGYIIDLAFRTNAANSSLQLQAEAVDRIYEEGSNTNTMGHGATMSFTSASDTFSATAMKNLMSAIRVVFFKSDSRDIIGYARLDADKTTDDNGKTVMPLFMCDEDGVRAADSTIMALEQNTIHELSVLVYLDGNLVGNDDVAVDVAQSMTGSMNLQFSSDATLTAMEYSDLMSGTGGSLEGSPTTPSQPDTPNPIVTDVEEGTVTDGYTADVKHVAVGTTYKLVAVITKDASAVTEGVTVKIGGVDATYQTVGALAGWVVDGTETVPATAVDVEIATA